MRTKLVIAAFLLIVILGASFVISRRSGREPTADGGVLSEVLVRQALSSGLAADIEWDEIALSIDPPAVTLRGVRAAWRADPETIVHANSLVVHLAGPGGEANWRRSEQLEILSAHFEGLRLELPGVASTHHQLAFRQLDVRRILPGSRHGRSVGGALPAASQLTSTASPTSWQGSGAGEFEAGGTLRFDVHADGREDRRLVKIAAHFADLPPGDWAVFVPELRDADGTISGQLDLEIGGATDAPRAADRASSAASEGGFVDRFEGRFEIDATLAGLSVAGAYRKRVGDPATLTGRFTRSPDGKFDFPEVRLSIRKAAAQGKREDAAEAAVKATEEENE